MGILPVQLPWWIGGPLLGLTVAAMFAVSNKAIGASGTYAQLSDAVLQRPVKEPWRLWFMFGVMIGAYLYGAFSSRNRFSWDYGALGTILPLPILLFVLFIGGICMGWGARIAGGCTSGHGLSGTAVRSPASFLATASFFVTALIVTAIIHILSGGLL